MQVEVALRVSVAKVPAGGAEEHEMFSFGFESCLAFEVLHSKWLLAHSIVTQQLCHPPLQSSPDPHLAVLEFCIILLAGFKIKSM